MGELLRGVMVSPVDGAIGELSFFHETFGVFGQGVSIATVTLPSGWRDRLVAFESAEAGASTAVCLEAHDLGVSKLVAGREKETTSSPKPS
jgi:hypothetical protein